MSVVIPAARPAEADSAGVAPDLLRSVLRHHAKGVAVITTGIDAPAGFCATSLTSVSLDPPVVLFAIGHGTSSWAAVDAAPHVMVHLLAEGQEDTARRFGQSGADRFGPGTRWHRGPYGLPVLDDVLAWMVLAQMSKLPVGDHALV